VHPHRAVLVEHQKNHQVAPHFSLHGFPLSVGMVEYLVI
jgi:hypothetical protein